MNPNEGGSDLSWVNLFLARLFFDMCRDHQGSHENQYCINCEMAACQRCLSEGTHTDHKVITIYRLVRNDVVALDEMARHIDCSSIQPYMSNGRLVLALHPLPHCNSGQLTPHLSCHTCTRRLMLPARYNYCSIACKFQKENGVKKTKKPSVKPPAPNSDGDDDTGKECKRSGVRTRRRKGVPIRAPFF